MGARAKNKSVFDMTESELREQIDKDFAVWDQIMKAGCSDPFWEDGVNLNLVRNHIICDYHQLKLRMQEEAQLSLFDSGRETVDLRPIPPEVPDRFMVKNGTYAEIRIPRFEAAGHELVFSI